jgi:hypothetical protein
MLYPRERKYTCIAPEVARHAYAIIDEGLSKKETLQRLQNVCMLGKMKARELFDEDPEHRSHVEHDVAKNKGRKKENTHKLQAHVLRLLEACCYPVL